MSFIKDTFFGGAEKDAAKAQQKGIEKGIEATQQAAERARGDIFNLYPQAQQSLNQGFQGALDVFGQSLPAQVQAFQGGNNQAQQTLYNALPQIQNALLGGNLDFSQFQPQKQVTPDLGFFQQQLPQFGQTVPAEQPINKDIGYVGGLINAGNSPISFGGAGGGLPNNTLGGISNYLGGSLNGSGGFSGSDFLNKGVNNYWRMK